MINTVVMNIPTWLQGMIEEKRYRNTTDMSFDWRIPEPAINSWLKGTRRPSVIFCIKLAEATGRSVEDVARMAAENGEGAR